MRSVKLGLFFMTTVGALLLINTTLPADHAKIIVVQKQEVKETVYTLEDQSISLTVYDSQGNEHVLHLRSRSKLPMQEQVEILSAMLEQLPKERKFRTFFIGRLFDAFGADRTLSERLSAAAGSSRLWNKAKGAPYKGHENKAVKEIANQAQIYPELKELFARRGYAIQISDVEKVLIDPKSRLPYDGITWFSLSPSSNP